MAELYARFFYGALDKKNEYTRRGHINIALFPKIGQIVPPPMLSYFPEAK